MACGSWRVKLNLFATDGYNTGAVDQCHFGPKNGVKLCELKSSVKGVDHTLPVFAMAAHNPNELDADFKRRGAYMRRAKSS